MIKFVRVPVSQLKEVALNRLTQQVRSFLLQFLSLILETYFPQLISDRNRDKYELYSDLAEFTRGNVEDFVRSNMADEEQWILDLNHKLEVNTIL
jgi:hypothetical protein